jgi:branched-chain amino acid:cation transporter, LIVCS family
MRLKLKNTFIFGFAIFAMFFGSGNLVFPIQIGLESSHHWGIGFLGLLLTGILLPLLSLIVIKLHRGNYNQFFEEAGTVARLVIPLIALSLMSSFGVFPRCITVAHGGLQYIFPKVSLIGFSIIFCIICYAVCLKDKFMVSVVGKWMTPILLVSLCLLIALGIRHSPEIQGVGVSSLKALSTGFLQGYQTMDLIAGFFFSSLIFIQVQQMLGKDAPLQQVIKASLWPSFIGASLLGLVYLGLVFLGAHFKDIIQGVEPQLMLPKIAGHIMGDQASFLIGIIVIFSCLTTAVALNNIYAQYLLRLFKLDNNKFPLVLLMTTTIAFFVSLLDFKGIASFLAPILELIYPSLIFLTIASLATKKYIVFKKVGFYSILLFMLYSKFF